MERSAAVGSVAGNKGQPMKLILPAGFLLGLILVITGCASNPPATRSEEPEPAPVVQADLTETPPPPGSWRPHQLADCPQDTDVPQVVERYLGICSEYFRDGSGSDAMIEMEMGLEQGHRHSLMLLTLGQLYLMAGQGDPRSLPARGRPPTPGAGKKISPDCWAGPRTCSWKRRRPDPRMRPSTICWPMSSGPGATSWERPKGCPLA